MNHVALACAAIVASVSSAGSADAATFLVFGNSAGITPVLTLNGSSVVDAYDFGHFDSNGFHLNNTRDYSTGSIANPGGAIEYRSFFSFNVTGKPISSASIKLGNAISQGYVNEAGGPLELTLYDVSSAIVPFTQYNGVKAIFDDLGAGTVLGSIRIDGAASSYTITLNQAGLDALNDPFNFGYVTLGARLTALPAAVPEPGAWALMIAGFGLMGGALRARRRLTVTYAGTGA